MAVKVAYWITTALIALAYSAGGFFDIKQPEEMMQQMASFGYPSYFFTMLGIWKLGAVVTLLAPGLPRLKEWAYAGILINLIGASVAHAVRHDPIGNIITPLVLLAIMLTSWALRPASRKLPGPWL
ncbi:MAG: DoxX family protein [Pirellula sp.]|nr:DoxX family protein [Pirellula sp.]